MNVYDFAAIFIGYLLYNDIKHGVAKKTDKPYEIQEKKVRSIYLGIMFTLYAILRLLDLLGLIDANL